MINPYDGVNLQSCERILSVSHQHLSHSSEAQAQVVFDRIYSTGVRHFPIVQYRPSLPSYDYSTDTFKYVVNKEEIPPFSTIDYIKDNFRGTIHGYEDCIGGSNAEHVYCKLLYNGVWNKWSSVHMIGMGSAYESYHMDENGLYTGNNGLEIPYSTAITKILSELTYPDGGGVIITHPNWTNNNKHFDFDVKRFIMDCLDYDPRVLGTDVIESGSQGGLSFDNNLVDEILSTGRRCWITCQPDWASLNSTVRKYRDRGRNELLIPSGLTRLEKDHECMKAYRNGAFFGRYANSELSVTGISFENNIFSITAENADGINIVTDGVTTTYTGATTASQQIDPNAKYVRAYAYINRDDDPDWAYFDNDVYKDIVFTNPIMINPIEFPYQPAYDVSEEPNNGKRFSLLYWG